MALGTATLADQGGKVPQAPLFAIRLSFAGDDSYPTGGTAAFQAFVRGAVSSDVVVIDVISGDCGDNKCEYDKTNDKLKVRVISTAAEVAGSTDLSGTTFNVTVLAQ